MASESGFYPEFSGFLQYLLAEFAQEPIPTKANTDIDTDRARQVLSNQHLISQIPSFDA